jgi:quercetin dioxygenase-like cupin family protein
VRNIKIFHYEHVNAEEAYNGSSKLKVRWLITEDMGANNFVMRLFELEPNSHSPFHRHSWEHEVFILEGEGLVVNEQTENKVKAGYVIFIPRNEKHQFKNTGESLLKFLCLVPTTKSR